MRSLHRAIVVMLLVATTVGAQGRGGGGRGGPPAQRDTVKRVHVVPGDRDGPSMFALTNYPELKPVVAGQVDFKHYHTSAEIEQFMQKWAKDYPDLVDLYVVGKSFGGRDLWQMTITNKKTGRDVDKPAAFFEGGRHSGEISGTEATFYLMWMLLDQYGKDPRITKLVDQKAIYLRPNNNPDGADMYRLTAQANRSSVRPVDDDGDGLFDEDPADDMNGDGYVLGIRKFVGAGRGNAVVDPKDPKGRLMQSVDAGQGDYMIYREGIDNDKDGLTDEDGVGGLDLHRNYPYNWRPMREATGRGYTQFGAGEYPLSEPETRAVYLWVVSHMNIGVANSMDTSVPMHLRGPSTCEETECVYPSDLKLLKQFDSLGLKHTKYPWAGDVFRTYATRGNPAGQPNPLWGHGPDFGYFSLGIVWYGDEIWNGGREKDYDNSGNIDQYEVLRWCDEEYQGACFIPWTKMIHPVHGEVETGGMNPKFWSQNGPPSSLERWAGNQARFNLDLALALPQVEIVSATSSALRGAQKDSATHEIRVTVRNTGMIPTALEQAKRMKTSRPDMLTARPPAGSATRVIGPVPEFWLGGNETKVVTLRVKAGPAAADRTLSLQLTSTKGGLSSSSVQITP
jgi:hypothetical protein